MLDTPAGRLFTQDTWSPHNYSRCPPHNRGHRKDDFLQPRTFSLSLGTIFPDLNLPTMQFVGGDTAEGTLPLLRSFRRGNKGALLAYSVEVDPATATSHGEGTLSTDDLPYKRIIKEVVHSIDVAADFEDSLNDGGRRTWVAIKIVSRQHAHTCRDT